MLLQTDIHSPTGKTETPRNTTTCQRIGQRMRDARIAAGLDEAALAAKLSLNPGTLRHYESGRLDVPVSLLADLGRCVRQPLAYFFADLPPHRPSPASIARDRGIVAEQRNLLRAYGDLPDVAARRNVLGLLKAIAEDRG